MTPANDGEIERRARHRTKLGHLIYNTSHINEHYGNLVTYLRLNNMVPPRRLLEAACESNRPSSCRARCGVRRHRDPPVS